MFCWLNIYHGIKVLQKPPWYSLPTWLLITPHIPLSKYNELVLGTWMCQQECTPFFNNQHTPRLQLTLKGIQMSQVSTQPPRMRLPITLHILGSIKTLLSKQPHSYLNIIWVTCCIAYFWLSACQQVYNSSWWSTQWVMPLILPQYTRGQ